MAKVSGKTAALVLMLLALAGCGGGPRYFRLPIDFEQVRRVAVLPIQNLTREPAAGEKVRRLVVAELLAQGKLQVVEPGVVDRTMHQVRVGSRYSLSPDEVKELGEALGVQALVSGAASEYALTRAGGNQEAPEVAVELFMIDVASGSVVWSAAQAESGLNFWVRHFGAEPLRVSEQARRTVHEMMATFFAGPTRQPFAEDARYEQERVRRQAVAEARGAREKRMGVLDEMLSTSLSQQIHQKVAQIKRSEGSVRILCAMDVFFDFGKVELSSEGKLVIERLAAAIRERAAGQTVEVAVFPEEAELSEEVQARHGTLWELSAARAAALLQGFSAHGLDPSRLKASYYGAKRTGMAASERVEIDVTFPLAEERQPPEVVDLSGGV